MANGKEEEERGPLGGRFIPVVRRGQRFLNDFFGGGPQRTVDGADAYANNHDYYIYFQHIPTGLTVKFKAFLTEFEDQYESRWNDVDVYGRMDPICTFQGTRRDINFSFDVPAASLEEAIRNYQQSKNLVEFLYPVYERTSGQRISATSIAAPPLLRIKFVNLISSKREYARGIDMGLVGKLSSLSYNPDFEAGVFDSSSGLLPKLNSFSCNFTVLHTENLGYTAEETTFGDVELEPIENLEDQTPTQAELNAVERVISENQVLDENTGDVTTVTGGSTATDAR